MTDAPDRIWARPEHDDENSYGGFWIKGPVEAGATEYIRADLSQAAVEALEAKLAKAVEGLIECAAEIDSYIWHEYPGDHPVHERYRKRDFDANPARATLAELTGGKDD